MIHPQVVAKLMSNLDEQYNIFKSFSLNHCCQIKYSTVKAIVSKSTAVSQSLTPPKKGILFVKPKSKIQIKMTLLCSDYDIEI